MAQNYNWQAQLWAQWAREQGYSEEYIESVVGKQNTYNGPTIGPAKPNWEKKRTISAEEKKKLEKLQKAIAATKRDIVRDLSIGMGTNNPQAQESVAGINSMLYNPSTALIGLNPAAGVGGIVGGLIGSNLLGDYMANEYGEAGERFGSTLGGLAGGIIGGSIGGLFNPKVPPRILTKKPYSSPQLTTMSMDNSIATGDHQYVIQKLPGYLLRSFLKGNPLERFILPNGMISTRTIRLYMSNPKRPLLDRRVVEYVLNNIFDKQSHVDYNTFRLVLQTYLTRSEGHLSNDGMSEGIMAAYNDPIIVPLKAVLGLIRDASFKYNFTSDNIPALANGNLPIIGDIVAVPYKKGLYKLMNSKTNQPVTGREIALKLGVDNYLYYLTTKNYGNFWSQDIIPYSFADDNWNLIHNNPDFDWLGFDKDQHLSFLVDREDPNIVYSLDNKIYYHVSKSLSLLLEHFRRQNPSKNRAKVAASNLELAREKAAYKHALEALESNPFDDESLELNIQNHMDNAFNHYYKKIYEYDPLRLTAIYHALKHLDEITMQRLLLMASKLGAGFSKRPGKVRIPTKETYKAIEFEDNGDMEPVYRYNSERLAEIYKHMFRKSEVPIVTDKYGRTWYEFEVPRNYLESEIAYKKGGKL